MSQWFEAKVLQSGNVEYLTLLVFMVGLCVFLLYRTYSAYRRWRFMSGTATSKIRSAPQGYVELKGTGELMPGGVLQSPFSGSRCLWYQCTIDHRQKSGKRTTWTHISTETSDDMFHLVDDTGICVIDPEDAHVIAESDQTWYGSTTTDRLSPPRRSKIIHKLATGEYRFNEKLIRPATAIYVLGLFRTLRHTPSTAYIDKQIKALLRQWKLQPHRDLSQFDMNGNGEIQKREWRAIQHKARQQVVSSMEQHQAQNLLSDPGQSGQPFILSAVREEKLVFRKKVLAISTGGIAFLIFIILINVIAVRPP